MLDEFTEVNPLPGEHLVSYATADDLLTVSDLPERNVTIRRWHRNGKALTIRIRALDLDQQDKINQESIVKNKKTGDWEQSEPVFCAASLRELCVVPKLTNEQAQAMRKHNPIIIRKLVNFGWLLSALDDDTIEQMARLQNPPNTPTADVGDDTSAAG